ncbi:MAG: NAD(P)H-dependent oxidoreductase [Acidimicrobiia bacterium]
MKVLIVFCHPVPDSFGAEIRDTVTTALSDEEVRLIDLYSGVDLPRDFTDADGAALSWAEAAVLVYPT